jgi:hypothetical protein
LSSCSRMPRLRRQPRWRPRAATRSAPAHEAPTCHYYPRQAGSVPTSSRSRVTRAVPSRPWDGASAVSLSGVRGGPGAGGDAGHRGDAGQPALFMWTAGGVVGASAHGSPRQLARRSCAIGVLGTSQAGTTGKALLRWSGQRRSLAEELVLASRWLGPAGGIPSSSLRQHEEARRP